MKFFQAPDLFAGLSREKRLEYLRQIGAEAKRKFEELLPRVQEWFGRYDAVYLLSFCAVYFLSSPEGVDQEAIEGKLDFYHHDLELLQAFALALDRAASVEPLLNRAEELKEFMQELNRSILRREFAFPDNIVDDEIEKRRVLAQMRVETLAVRNWAYPDQISRVVTEVFEKIAPAFVNACGIEPGRLIGAFQKASQVCEDKLNQHMASMRRVWRAKNHAEAWAQYCQAFPDLKREPGDGSKMFEQFGENTKAFKAALLVHSDLRLSDTFTFTLNEFSEWYGQGADQTRLRATLDALSLAFGELKDRNPEHFILNNPALHRPFIRLRPDTYFCPLVGIMYHMLPGLMEELLRGCGDAGLVRKYERARSRFLEEETEKLFRAAVNGHVFRGSKWKDPQSGVLYENDVLIIVPPFACVIECKSGFVDPPAKRGAEYRLVDTLEDLVVAPSEQANRFVRFLSANPGLHEFATESGELNRVDNREVKFYLPLSVTYENLGTISGNLKEAAAAGLIEKLPNPMAPSICLTDLETILHLLKSEIELIHYLARRSQIQQEFDFMADEMDLLAFYLETGFNMVGETEEGVPLKINMILKSKELDPYFTARIAGRAKKKPQLEMTQWWRDILSALKERQVTRWIEIGYALLNAANPDQVRLEQLAKELADEVRRSQAQQTHKGCLLKTGSGNRAYGVAIFAYGEIDRNERNNRLREIAANAIAEHELLGVVCIGVRARKPGYPYDVLAYLSAEEISKSKDTSEANPTGAACSRV